MAPSTLTNTAIIITDPYNDFLHPSGKAHGLIAESLEEKDTIKHLQHLVATARIHGIPIYYGLHQQSHLSFLAGWKHATKLQQFQLETKGFEEGSWGVEIFEGLQPDLAKGDVIVNKHWCSSSFQNTDLDYQLHQREITNLVLAGLTANTCLEATARYAYELGYNITMLKDATAGFAKDETDAATDLVWPLFADKVVTVEEWASTL